MWQLGGIDNTFTTLQRSDFAMQYPLSPQQRAVYMRYYSLVQARQRNIYGTWNTGRVAVRNQDPDCPGTGKTQVVKPIVHTLIEEEYSVTVCTPLGLLATN